MFRVNGNSTNPHSAYEYLLAFHSNYVPMLHRLRYMEILVENRWFNLQNLYLVPLLVVAALESEN